MFFRKKSREQQERPVSITKGLLAGVAGGLVGALAKSYAERLVPPQLGAADAMGLSPAAAAIPEGLSPRERELASTGLHWAFGTVIGGIYGVLVEVQPKTASWAGIPFGLTVNRITQDRLLPNLGLADPAAEHPAQERVSQWTTHLAYGVATELVRSAVRKRL